MSDWLTVVYYSKCIRGCSQSDDEQLLVTPSLQFKLILKTHGTLTWIVTVRHQGEQPVLMKLVKKLIKIHEKFN